MEQVGDHLFVWEPEAFLSEGERSRHQHFDCNLGCYDSHGFSTYTVLIGEFSDVPGEKSSIVMIPYQICTGKRCLPVRHWVNVAFLTPFFCVRNVRDTFLTNVCGRCCVLYCVVSCRNWFPPSIGCVFVYSTLWGLQSNPMINLQRKSYQNELSYSRAQVGVPFPVNMKH